LQIVASKRTPRSKRTEVPVEIDEAAPVDGCSRASAFVRVVLPLTAPGSPRPQLSASSFPGTSSCLR
jgi:hypothetical protein